MKYTTLGSTGARVSRICLGTWQLGGEWGEAVREGGIRSVSRALDLGINFFDTAAVYGNGKSEAGLAEGLGDALRTRREEIVISTKGGVEIRRGASQQGAFRNCDESFLRSGLERSLRILGTEYVDVFTIHWPDMTIPFEETAGVLKSFVAEGLVRHIGISNFDVEQTNEIATHCEVAINQLPFSLLDRRIAVDIIPFCEERGMEVLAWGPLAHGVLGGELPTDSSKFAKDDWRAQNPAFQGDKLRTLADVVAQLAERAEKLGCTLPQLAVAWMLNSPYKVTPIVGALEPAHVDAAVGALEIELSEAEIRRLEEIVEPVHPFSLGTLDGEGIMQQRSQKRS
ncbi:aldo/keto reductase [Kineobactrum salinum]|uniref:Aldo/keto reductase n=1 Tax=Kineobactrum salinum TaxID=2708301 RepID=A0A6C0U391_9GAMM|nr:aldo/keto reductase [Kineobactrum salinum]QIB65909.1 aldo/keto reductase [Kineobactrum salinum]